MGALFQLFNILILVLLLGVPIVITVLLIRHFNKPKNTDDYILEKIRELERRIEDLENR